MTTKAKIFLATVGIIGLILLVKKSITKKLETFKFDFVTETADKKNAILVVSEEDAEVVKAGDKINVSVLDGDKAYAGEYEVISAMMDVDSKMQYITINKPKNKAANGKITIIKNK